MELERLAAMRNPRPLARRDGAQGAVSWVTLLLVLGIALAAYLAYVFGPPYILHYEVKQVVRDYGNRAVKNPHDAELVEDMVSKIRSLDHAAVVDDSGHSKMVPTVDLRAQDVVWERLAEPPSLHVAFEYPRTLDLPLLDRTLERVYRVDLTMDLRLPDWGPSR